MGTAPDIDLRLTGCRLALALCLGLLQAPVQAAQPSDLSRWMSATLAPQVTAILADHPRYRGRPVMVVNRGGDALGDAVVVVLRSTLSGHAAIALVSQAEDAPPPVGRSVDDLTCRPVATGDLQLSVDVQADRSRGDRVSIELVETGTASPETPRLWHWAGKLTRTERNRARQAGASRDPDGSLESPWSEADVEAAARSLTRDFACSLRPTIATRLRLQWTENPQLPPVFRDTANTSRHLLGGYRELALAEGAGDYRVRAELRPFRGDTFQLWLTGRPQVPRRDPVQAVTYFRVAGLSWPPAADRASRPSPSGDADKYLVVEMLGVRQADRGRSGADLRVALRLVNRAAWPIAYALRLSGGHFMHCIARPSYYRHDRYGTLSGTLAPGDAEVRDLVIEKLRHVPLPWFGPARCAGSVDLEALEHFATQGYRVTDYVRWDL